MFLPGPRQAGEKKASPGGEAQSADYVPSAGITRIRFKGLKRQAASSQPELSSAPNKTVRKPGFQDSFNVYVRILT
jgi:hypothetical protein